MEQNKPFLNQQQTIPIQQQPVLPEQQSHSDIPEKKPNKLLKIVIIVIVLLVIMSTGAFGFWIYQEKIVKKPVPSPSPSIIPFDALSPITTSTPESTIPNDLGVYCQKDKDCPSGYFCDFGIVCGGPPLEGKANCSETGSKQCIKSCEKNEDCPGEERCERFSDPSGDAIGIRYGCKK